MKRKSFFGTQKFQTISTTHCGTCGLSQSCKSPKLKAVGAGKKGILIIGTHPTANEDTIGSLGHGESFNLLKDHLFDTGADFDMDCVYVTLLACKPMTKLNPVQSKNAYAACFPAIEKLINEMKPKVIILLGAEPIKSIIGRVWKKGISTGKPEDRGVLNPVVDRWRGWAIPFVEYSCWVIPTLAPMDLLIDRVQLRDTLSFFFRKDLALAVECADKPFEAIIEPESYVSVLDEENSIAWLKWTLLIKPAYLAYDYETTGLKPYNKNQEAMCISFCCSNDTAVAFMITDGNIGLLREVMQDPDIGLMAHNKRFELLWTVCKLGVYPRNLCWDSMIAAHQLDSRSGICSLKFQSFIHFGVADYDSLISKYIKSEDICGNTLNRVKDAPEKELLLYCGIDSLVEYRLAIKQMCEMGFLDIDKHKDVIYINP